MQIDLIVFEENPEGFIQRAGKGHTAFDWLVSRFGLPATVKIFIDMVRYRVGNGEASLTFPHLHIPGTWIQSDDIDSIANWETTPQGHTFWSILANELDDDVELTYDEIEMIANAIYSDKPLTPEDI